MSLWRCTLKSALRGPNGQHVIACNEHTPSQVSVNVVIITCCHWRRCIPKHPGASLLAHALLPSGWMFRTVPDEHEEIEINAEDVAALAAGLPAGTGPLRLVWCLPPQLWAGFTARWVMRQSGIGAGGRGQGSARSGVNVQQHALEVQASGTDDHSGGWLKRLMRSFVGLKEQAAAAINKVVDSL